MKHIIYFLCLFICSSLWIQAQQDDDDWHIRQQRLLDILDTNQYFDAKAYYNTLKIKGDTLHPFIECFYNRHAANFLNKPDSAARYLNELLTKYGPFGIGATFYFYYQLWKLYAETLQDYEKALETCERIKAYLEENPERADEDLLNEWTEYTLSWEKQTRRRAAEPTIRIFRDSSKNSLPLTGDGIDFVIFEAEYNGKKRIKTGFDTGVTEFFVIDKDMAEQIGVRKYPIYDNDTIVTFNGMETSGYPGILDSVRIANIRLYHIPVMVVDRSALMNVSDSTSISSEKKDELELFFQSFDIIMGLPTMNLIGKIAPDIKNRELHFPPEETNTCNDKEPNLFLFMNKLFTQASINDLPFTAFIDTGASDYVTIDSEFYEKNREQIPIDSSQKKKPLNIAMLHNIRYDIPHEIADNPILTWNGHCVHPGENDKVCIYSLQDWEKAYSEITEGVLGYNFFKALKGKIVFDFKNMRLEVQQERQND